MTIKAKPKKKPAKKAKTTIAMLERRLNLIGPHVANLAERMSDTESRLDKALGLLEIHAEQLDKHQRTLELIEQREQFILPKPDGEGGFSGPQ